MAPRKSSRSRYSNPARAMLWSLFCRHPPPPAMATRPSGGPPPDYRSRFWSLGASVRVCRGTLGQRRALRTPLCGFARRAAGNLVLDGNNGRIALRACGPGETGAGVRKVSINMRERIKILVDGPAPACGAHWGHDWRSQSLACVLRSEFIGRTRKLAHRLLRALDR